MSNLLGVLELHVVTLSADVVPAFPLKSFDEFCAVHVLNVHTNTHQIKAI